MDGPLDREQVETFLRDGFLACPQLLCARHPEIVEFVDEIASWPDEAQRWVHHREVTPEGTVLARTENFLDYHQGLQRLLTEGMISQALGQLFGEPAVVFKEKINYKAAGGGGFHAHQDIVAYPLGSAHITCLIAIDANTIENGCLWFAPGRYTGVLPVNERGCLADEVAQSLPWRAATLAPGGVLFFSSLVPHRSDTNNSSLARRSLYVTYSKASEGDLRAEYYQDRQRKLADHAGQDDGEVKLSSIGHFQGRTSSI